MPNLNRATAPKELSDREVEVLTHVALGLSGKAIARILEISPKTVEKHRSNIRWKTGAKNSADFARFLRIMKPLHCPGCRCHEHEIQPPSQPGGAPVAY